jgi:alkyldihydroxyacetonephosphate synthase
MRKGKIEAAPDMVVYPHNEQQVALVVEAAKQNNVVVIPFGGGSNIAGCLEANRGGDRFTVSLDMKEMNQVLNVDHDSLVATIQAGVMGPYMEQQLQAQGVTLGHFPDSFVYSTLGGWVATRSAGMQSDKYGKIEDMVLSVRMVTPQGTIETRAVPKNSNGIDVNALCVGSEGIFGIITQVTIQVHRLPESRQPYGYIFPDWESGIRAMQECTRKGVAPVVSRLNDPMKTALSFAYKTHFKGLKNVASKLVKFYLDKIKRFDRDKLCLMITIFEGSPGFVAQQKNHVHAVYKKHGAVCLGQDPGRSFEKGKYDFPHIRDIVMDKNIMADVSETATVWHNVLPLYHATMKNIEQAALATGHKPFVGAHVSHTYHSGASLYFTFACEQQEGLELEQYLYIKKAAQDSFLNHGGTLSHHHAVGTEHLPWVEKDISATGVRAVQGIKDALDPQNIMNPGKIIPSQKPLVEWNLSEEMLAQYNAQLPKT